MLENRSLGSIEWQTLSLGCGSSLSYFYIHLTLRRETRAIPAIFGTGLENTVSRQTGEPGRIEILLTCVLKVFISNTYFLEKKKNATQVKPRTVYRHLQESTQQNVTTDKN